MIHPNKGGRPKADLRAVKAWAKHRPKGIGELAAHLKISQPGVSKWAQVPEPRVPEVAQFLGLEPWQLRPDIYAPPASPWAELSTNKRTN